MHNPIFTIISSNEVVLRKAFQAISRKQATSSGKHYFLITPKQIGQSEIFIGAVSYRALDWHISVYEDLKEEEGHGKASYHLTLKMARDQEVLVVRTYFNHFNNILYINVKDESGVIQNTPSENTIHNFVSECILSFSNQIWKLYTEQHTLALIHYNQLLNILTEQSATLEHATTLREAHASWAAYQIHLEALIRHLDAWHRFELQPNLTAYNHFINLQSRVRAKLNELVKQMQDLEQNQISDNETSSALYTAVSVGPATQISAQPISPLDILNQRLNDLNGNSNLPSWIKLPQEYALLEKKFALIANDDDALDCVLRMRELEKQAYKELIRLLLPNSGCENINEVELVELIKLIPYIPTAQFVLAITNNRLTLLRLLLQYHRTINLNQIIPQRNVSILEYAYDLKRFEIFQFLLEAGAFYDQYNSDGKTLLMKACQEKCNKEMVALLQAGASNLLRDKQGYTAIAYLVMSEKEKPNLELVNAFIEHCRFFLIDFMQGPEQYRGTIFNFACQKNWYSVAKVLLEHGADPAMIRMTDKLNALDICAAKNHATLCELILNASKHSIAECCAYALKIAKQFNSNEVITLLEAYMQKSNIPNEVVRVCKVGVGSSLDTLDGIIGHNMFRNKISGGTNIDNRVPITSMFNAPRQVNSPQNNDEREGEVLDSNISFKKI